MIPYQYHTRQEFRSGVMRYNSQCPACRAIRKAGFNRRRRGHEEDTGMVGLPDMGLSDASSSQPARQRGR